MHSSRDEAKKSSRNRERQKCSAVGGWETLVKKDTPVPFFSLSLSGSEERLASSMYTERQ